MSTCDAQNNCHCCPSDGDRPLFLTNRQWPERFYIGPTTNELILNIGRIAALDPVETVVKIKVYKHDCGIPDEDDIFEMTSFDKTEQGDAHFELSGTFLSDVDKFPKGLYIGKVYVNDCLTDTIQIVKATSMYVSGGRTVADKCYGDTDWVEPDCNSNEEVEETTDTDTGCECWEMGKAGCPYCLSHVSKLPVVDENMVPSLDTLFEDI